MSNKSNSTSSGGVQDAASDGKQAFSSNQNNTTPFPTVTEDDLFQASGGGDSINSGNGNSNFSGPYVGSTPILVEVVLVICSVILAVILFLCLFRYLYRKFRWQLCCSRRSTTTAQTMSSGSASQQNPPTTEAENEEDLPNFFGTLHLPIQATDNFLEYAMSMPFLFGRPSPFISTNDPFFIGPAYQFPPKYEDAIIKNRIAPNSQQARILSANMRETTATSRRASPPPLYDTRNAIGRQCITAAPVPRISRTESRESNEQPPAYMASLAPQAQIRNERLFGSVVSTGNHHTNVHPVISEPMTPTSTVSVVLDPEKKFSRGRFASADAAFMDIPQVQQPTGVVVLDPKALLLDERHRNIAQSTSSLSTMLTTVEVETARRKSSDVGTSSMKDEERLELSRSHRTLAQKQESGRRMVESVEQIISLENPSLEAERRLTTRSPSRPLSTALSFVPKLQRRLSFSTQLSITSLSTQEPRIKSANNTMRRPTTHHLMEN